MEKRNEVSIFGKSINNYPNNSFSLGVLKPFNKIHSNISIRKRGKKERLYKTIRCRNAILVPLTYCAFMNEFQDILPNALLVKIRQFFPGSSVKARVPHIRIECQSEMI